MRPPFCCRPDEPLATRCAEERCDVGASLQLASSTTLYGDVNYQTTFGGDAWGVGGNIGLTVNW